MRFSSCYDMGDHYELCKLEGQHLQLCCRPRVITLLLVPSVNFTTCPNLQGRQEDTNLTTSVCVRGMQILRFSFSYCSVGGAWGGDTDKRHTLSLSHTHTHTLTVNTSAWVSKCVCEKTGPAFQNSSLFSNINESTKKSNGCDPREKNKNI